MATRTQRMCMRSAVCVYCVCANVIDTYLVTCIPTKKIGLFDGVVCSVYVHTSKAHNVCIYVCCGGQTFMYHDVSIR